MDFLKAVNIIGRDLEEAMALLEQLTGVSGPELAEIELAKSRVRSATKLLKLLPGLNGTKEDAPPVTDAQPASFMEPAHFRERDTANNMHSAPAPDPVPVINPQPEPAPEPEPAHKPEPAHTYEPAPEPAHKPEPAHAYEPAAGARPEPEPANDKKSRPQAVSQKSQEPSKPILADRFSQSGTLGDTISPARQDDVNTTAMHSKPIADIGAAIGINDRFYFIRELFSGDTLAYSDTIRRLNASASLGEAMRILDESTVMGSDPAAQSSFVDVVRRKFSLHV